MLTVSLLFFGATLENKSIPVTIPFNKLFPINVKK